MFNDKPKGGLLLFHCLPQMLRIVSAGGIEGALLPVHLDCQALKPASPPQQAQSMQAKRTPRETSARALQYARVKRTRSDGGIPNLKPSVSFPRQQQLLQHKHAPPSNILTLHVTVMLPHPRRLFHALVHLKRRILGRSIWTRTLLRQTLVVKSVSYSASSSTQSVDRRPQGQTPALRDYLCPQRLSPFLLPPTISRVPGHHCAVWIQTAKMTTSPNPRLREFQIGKCL